MGAAGVGKAISSASSLVEECLSEAGMLAVCIREVQLRGPVPTPIDTRPHVAGLSM
jgi:hypothetical protein